MKTCICDTEKVKSLCEEITKISIRYDTARNLVETVSDKPIVVLGIYKTANAIELPTNAEPVFIAVGLHKRIESDDIINMGIDFKTGEIKVTYAGSDTYDPDKTMTLGRVMLDSDGSLYGLFLNYSDAVDAFREYYFASISEMIREKTEEIERLKKNNTTVVFSYLED